VVFCGAADDDLENSDALVGMAARTGGPAVRGCRAPALACGQEYFERHVLPAVGDRAVVLNWSERTQWRYSLAGALFSVFAGSREFNPLAVVFRPFAWPQRFRFYRPFRAFKHGRPEEVELMRRAFLEMLNGLAPAATGERTDA
jgi:hypothetical protein